MSTLPIPLAITCGDPAGVGPEIAAAWLGAHPEEARDVTLVGPASWLRSLELAGFGAHGRAVGPAGFLALPGRPTVEGAGVALAALEEAAAGARRGEFAAVVTGPVSKTWLQKAGFTFPGQTEFFAARWGGEPTMAFAGGKLRVVLATWHVPLRGVWEALTDQALARAVERAQELGRAAGVGSPRIGVCGLNPHAGEEGLLGREEIDRLNPLLARLRAAFPGVSDCQPADTLFTRAMAGEFDVVVALYHDQGLAPLKVVDFDEAVNLTLGLPWVRTSPDHGTAFALAGKGLARATSFAQAVVWARRLAAR